MGKYIASKEFEGVRPFKCPRCRRTAAVDVQGICRLVITCARCKAKLTLEICEPLPPELALRAGELLNH